MIGDLEVVALTLAQAAEIQQKSSSGMGHYIDAEDIVARAEVYLRFLHGISDATAATTSRGEAKALS
jgi:hypothetical protein